MTGIHRAAAVLLAAALLAGCGFERPAPSSAAPAAAGAASEAAVKAAEPPGGGPLDSGRFYDKAQFDAAVRAPREYSCGGLLRGAMVQHHLVAADMIAGVFSHAAQDREAYDTVLILSPSHFAQNAKSEIVTATADWATPFGLAAADTVIARALLDDSALGAANDAQAVGADHGAAGLVPFVRYYLPDAKITACLISNKVSPGKLLALEEAVQKICAAKRVLLISSCDCSHGLSAAQAAQRDEMTREAIESFDFLRLARFDDRNTDSPQAVAALLFAARENGWKQTFLDRSVSSEKLPQAEQDPAYAQASPRILSMRSALNKPQKTEEHYRSETVLRRGESIGPRNQIIREIDAVLKRLHSHKDDEKYCNDNQFAVLNHPAFDVIVETLIKELKSLREFADGLKS
jgi:AmmeMemoRadiSam system protein B